MKKFRIKSRVRFSIFIALLSVLITFSYLFLVGGTIVSDTEPEAAPAYSTVTVESGDTVWTIAEKYTGKNQDIRDTVQTILDLNGMKSSGDLQAGQTLQVPKQV